MLSSHFWYCDRINKPLAFHLFKRGRHWSHVGGGIGVARVDERSLVLVFLSRLVDPAGRVTSYGKALRACQTALELSKQLDAMRALVVSRAASYWTEPWFTK